MLQGGPGVPVVVCNGFLSENGKGWGEWQDIITTRYPDSPVYRVHWGAKELKDLGVLGGGGAARFAGRCRPEGGRSESREDGREEAWPARPGPVRGEVGEGPLARR